jgi:hypothetical protein
LVFLGELMHDHMRRNCTDGVRAWEAFERKQPPIAGRVAASRTPTL